MAVWYAVGCNAVGWRAPKKRSDYRGGSAAACGVHWPQSQLPPQPPAIWGGKTLIEKTGKILNEKTGKNLHKFNQNEVSKSRLKSNAMPG